MSTYSHEKRYKGTVPSLIDAFLFLSQNVLRKLKNEFKGDEDIAFFDSTDWNLMTKMASKKYVVGSEFVFIFKSKDCVYYFACRIKKQGKFDAHYLKAGSKRQRDTIKQMSGYVLKSKRVLKSVPRSIVVSKKETSR